MNAEKWGRAVLAALLTVSLAAPGCVKKPHKDAFIEHWDARAVQSEGYSPSSHPRRIEFKKAAIDTKKDKAPEKPARPLPTQKMTLRMYDTDLVAVVRAMARAANQNVVLSSSIPGATGAGEGQQGKGMRINVNVADAPWDETFKSILASNGLTYSVEGDIIRVMTVADMEQQQKLKEATNKVAAEAARARELEPDVTARVEINYAELSKMYATLSAMCGASGATMPGQQAKPQTPVGQTVRNITPDRSANDTIKLQGQGGHRPGQLNCSIVPDQHSNSIIIQAPEADAKKLVALIEELDKPRPQVKLKAFIVQTDRNTAQALGVQWGGVLKGSNFRMSPAQQATTSTSMTAGNNGMTSANAASSGSTLTGSGSVSNANTGSSSLSNVTSPIFPGGSSGNGFGLNYPALTNSLTTASGLGAAGAGVNFLFGKIGENVLEAQLTALAEDNKVKILASPTITTMENQTAFVENGMDVPYTSTSQNGTNVQFANATLRLEILPHVVDGTNLRMKITVKDDQVDTSRTVDGNPYIYKRETQSNLVVEDRETIVISGLVRDTVSDGNSGVPFLRDIPGLGWAFKSKNSSVEREQMLIFITPIILKEKPIAPVPPVADRVDPKALSPVAAAEAARP
ncbi:type II and III secretion system protein [Solidesulfovibrio fructosivorans JJ]]|uniref:Type II and III secretion system protein n=2 Tax=Solidesulfovibrio fructosivorans TaxID=878 RepID=E1K0G3_SOLFR|nr:type II and III secretion system protein [Solidesulfovibrio fructosivorans JJ]]